MSTRNYEAMFILDNSAATADFEETSAQVDTILEKHGATIVQKEKWDERKLAYEIKGQRRGTYYLTYFSADPDAIRKINEDVQLNETILRHLVLTLEVPIEEHIATQAAERERLAEDSRKNSLGGWGGGRRGERRGPPPRKRETETSEEAAPAEAATAKTEQADAPVADAAAEETEAAAEKQSAPADEKSAPADEKKSEPAATEASTES